MLAGILLMYICIQNDYPMWFEMASWLLTIMGTAKNVLKFMAFASGVKEGYGKPGTDKSV